MPSCPITANMKRLIKKAIRITRQKRLHALKIKIAKVLPTYADTVPVTPTLSDAAKFTIELVTFRDMRNTVKLYLDTIAIELV